MELEVSQKTAKICKALKLTAESMAFADLVAVGWEPSDAFIVAFHKGATWIKRALKDEVEKLMDSQSIKDRISQTKGELTIHKKEMASKEPTDVQSVIATAMSKEQMLYELQTAKAGKTAGTKEWIDINKMIIAVTRMKQEDVQTENTTIHHYLPVQYPTGCQDCLWQRCDKCKYKKAYKEEE